MKRFIKILLISLIALIVFSCAPAIPGPDKQFAGTMSGLLLGAGTGAVTGAQLGSAAGPGAAVGVGLGAIVGGVHGYVEDRNEDQMLKMSVATRSERERAVAQERLNDHYARRIELHPGRDIYPADLFFHGDRTKPRSSAAALVNEIAALNKTRYPWSRLGIAVYVQSKAKDPEYATRLALERSRELGDLFVRSGIEPRRIETRAVLVKAPVLIDPEDHSSRYSQAIEIIPLDRFAGS